MKTQGPEGGRVKRFGRGPKGGPHAAIDDPPGGALTRTHK